MKGVCWNCGTGTAPDRASAWPSRSIERITLEEKDGRTIVTKDVTVRNSGVPWFVVQLIWFIGRFGKPVGKDKLMEICEGDTA
jgi:hypothetical protein